MSHPSSERKQTFLITCTGVEGRDASHEPLAILNIPDMAYSYDGRDLIGVCFDATLGDDVPWSLPPGIPKVHFSGFSLIMKCLRLMKVSSRSAMRLLLCVGAHKTLISCVNMSSKYME
jgi:hypothetical protein